MVYKLELFISSDRQTLLQGNGLKGAGFITLKNVFTRQDCSNQCSIIEDTKDLHSCGPHEIWKVNIESRNVSDLKNAISSETDCEGYISGKNG